MPAPKGHKRWGNPRKRRKYTPEQLWESACEYFQWCDDNPFYEVEQIKRNVQIAVCGAIDTNCINSLTNRIIRLPKIRPYTIQGFCNHLNIKKQTFYNYSTKKYGETYFDVSTRIREIIYDQQFCGAASGLFNANIISYNLGLNKS